MNNPANNTDTIGMSSSQIGVFKLPPSACFRCILERIYSRQLESKVALQVLCHFIQNSHNGNLQINARWSAQSWNMDSCPRIIVSKYSH